ncbi:hypothetical protein EYF80_025754 [Liparis tanakae]|uniref:Uncharacterized protein n=1 Tax=Liparis tanakae TaxID=230148 RepID=A0A4Z2HEI7_9TELE|nr:hypothetical protein EYF80_025754 [Liparis tanakae]
MQSAVRRQLHAQVCDWLLNPGVTPSLQRDGPLTSVKCFFIRYAEHLKHDGPLNSDRSAGRL